MFETASLSVEYNIAVANAILLDMLLHRGLDIGALSAFNAVVIAGKHRGCIKKNKVMVVTQVVT